MLSILIVEDDITFSLMLTTWLGKKGFVVRSSSSVSDAKRRLGEEAFDLVISDLRLPDSDGIDLLKWLKSTHPSLPLIMMTSYAEIQTAVQAMKLGAADYIAKPLNPDELLGKIKELVRVEEKAPARVPVSSAPDLYIEGQSQAARQLYEHVRLVAPTDMSVLVTGASGTGKEYIARRIHEQSNRSKAPFVAVDCGAIPKELSASEFFGHVKGSFTGALSDRKGYFEVADGGTIFLDEVGELPTPTQARLLRVLETGEFIRVGSSKVQKTNVRIVAATNVNLTQAVAEGKFREDLFYRLSTVPIQVPPLRERGEDIILLFRKFASDCAEKYRMPPIRLDEEARQLMLSYRWPGNVRELKNITERISVIEENRDITASVLRLYLPDLNIEKYPVLVKQDSDQKIFNSEREILYQVLFDMKKDVNELKKLVHDIMGGKMPIEVPEEPAAYPHPIHTVHPVPSIQEAEAVEEEESLSLEEVEKEMIRKALEKHNGRRKNAAADLKISERTLYRKIKEYNLE